MNQRFKRWKHRNLSADDIELPIGELEETKALYNFVRKKLINASLIVYSSALDYGGKLNHPY